LKTATKGKIFLQSFFAEKDVSWHYAKTNCFHFVKIGGYYNNKSYMNVKASQFGNDSKPERILFTFYAPNDLPNNVLNY
jgi:hypothetical protein